MTVAARDRHSKANPCSVCGGFDAMERGQGERCYGYTNDNYCNCSNDAFAGTLPRHDSSGTYGHRLIGNCRCGVRHDPRPPLLNGHAGNGHAGRIVATYDYRNANGELLFQVVRKEPKTFLQRRPVGRDNWAWDLKGVSLVPYRFPELVAADLAAPVLITEGEKDADRLRSLGFVATCNAMGAGKWRDEYSPHLRARRAVILADNDQPGRDHAARVARSLYGIAASVCVVNLDGLPDKGDVSDWLDAGHSADELRATVATAPAWTPAQGVPGDTGDPAVDESDQWERPVPLREIDAPTFPLQTLPSWLRDYVAALAESTQTPRDMAATVALGVIAASVAGYGRVAVKAGYSEPLSLWVAAVAPPAERKTSVHSAMVAPILEWEAERGRSIAPDIAKAATEREIVEARLKDTKAAAARAKAGTERETLTREAIAQGIALAGMDVPKPPRRVVDDCTPERLATLIADNEGRMAVFSDEGGPFELMAGRYSNAPNLEVYLKGHAGSPLIVDRGARTEHVPTPALTMALVVQPIVIAGLADKPGFRGRGLIGRYLYSIPRSRLGHRRADAPAISDRLTARYTANLTALLNLTPPRDANGQPSSYPLRLTPEALDVWRQFHDAIEVRLGRDGDLHTISDWAGKLTGAVARIAGLLHLAEHAAVHAPHTIPISGATMAAAAEIGRYFIPHARVAFAVMGADDATEDARYILSWIERTQAARFAKREAWLNTRSRFERAAAIDKPLALLVEHGYIRQALPPKPNDQSRKAGRPASPVYEVNPLAHNTQNTHNSPNPDGAGDSAYCAYCAQGNSSESDLSDAVDPWDVSTEVPA